MGEGGLYPHSNCFFPIDFNFFFQYSIFGELLTNIRFLLLLVQGYEATRQFMKKLFIPLLIAFFFLSYSPAFSYADSMHCDYSIPLDYQGNTPTSSIDAFNFSESDCTISITPPVQYVGTPSAYIDVASTSALATGIHDYFYLTFFVFFVIVLFVGFSFGPLLFLSLPSLRLPKVDFVLSPLIFAIFN